MLAAALKALQDSRVELGGEEREVHDQLERFYRRRLALLSASPTEALRAVDGQERRNSVAQRLREVERATLLDLRQRNKIHDEVLRTLERELDLLDARFSEAEY
jgi:CPA1 family monovalent cation:H+ antiporter